MTNLIAVRMFVVTAVAFSSLGMSARITVAQAIDGPPAKVLPESETVATNAEASPLPPLVKEAVAAEAAGNLQLAAQRWESVLQQEIDAATQCRAHFHAGLCYSKQQKFEQSISHFKRGLKTATPESAADVPQALFYLGYSQVELGRALQTTPSKPLTAQQADDRQERSMELLTTGSLTLGRLLKRFPTFEGSDQAAFFQAKAFEQLGRLEEAIEAYELVLSYEQPFFSADARFGLGSANEQLGRYEDALEHYIAIADHANTLNADQLALLAESQFRAGEVLTQLAESLKQSDDRQAADVAFDQAFGFYEAVANQADNPQLIPLAIYGAAWSKMSAAVGSDQSAAAQQAAAWFTRLIEDYPDHSLVADAKVGRGSAQRLAGKFAAAEKDLNDVTKASAAGPRREDARLELGLNHVKQAKWAEAIGVFTDLIKDFPDSPAIDRYRYELAWAFRSAKPPQSDAALAQFQSIIETAPNSPLAAEAHYHLATAAYDRGEDDLAVRHFAVALKSDLPERVLERASYQLAWAEYRREDFAAAAEQFQRQLKVFPEGSLATDAKVMFAESQFRQDKHPDALQAYLVAKPAVDADGNVDPKMQMLTALHGAQSANEAQEHEEAIRFATPVTLTNTDEAYQADAWLEIGIARAALGEETAAINAWQRAVPSMSVTGAKARCLLGESLVKAQKYQEALNQFKLVYFGFGGIDAADDVRPWQAYALYEAARVNQRLCREAQGPVLRQRIDQAIEQYQRLLEHYGDSDLVEEAKRQVAKLGQF